MDRETPNVDRLLRTLGDYDVDYVLAGSVAVEAWGAEIGIPGDLDIIPVMDERNLRKLADAMNTIDAKPFPITGEWQDTPEGFRWHEFDESDPRRGALPPPLDPTVPESFDSLFNTIYGALDIVPVISGRFEDVVSRSTQLTVHGVDGVHVLGIEDLLAQLTVPRRVKDSARVQHLRKRQLGS